MLVVDAHCHLPEGISAKEMEKAFSLRFADRVWALSVPITHWVGTRDNDEVVLELARQFPEQIVPFGYLHLGKGPDWVDAQKQRGFAGLKAHTPPGPWDDDRFFPIYERAQALDMPIVFHTGQAWTDTLDHYPHAVGHRSRSTDWMHVERLDVIAKSFPRLRIVAAHLGWPHCEAAIGMAMTHPNVFLDTSGYLGVFLDSVARAINVYGIADKVLMGSDVMLVPGPGESFHDRVLAWQERVIFWKHYFANCFPHLSPGSPVAAGVSVADLVLAGNALRVVGLP
jgi:predicted TIM-barrel fold metal-dependent hydrolase